ncbi:hypothetical protein [Paraburkholderia dilworthii]|nr:hypothetical protein [Paraburkholderia dilworthii]
MHNNTNPQAMQGRHVNPAQLLTMKLAVGAGIKALLPVFAA